MATSWPSPLLETTLSGEGAKELGATLWDRMMVLRQLGTSVDFGDSSDAAGSWSSGAAVTVLVPKYARSGMFIRIWAKNTSSDGGNADYRARETGTPTNGTTQSTTSTAGVWQASDITIPDDTWAGTEKTFDIQSQGGGGTTATASVAKSMYNFQVSD